MNKFWKIFSIAMAVVFVGAFAACGCNSAEETTAAATTTENSGEMTLPVDEFDDNTQADNLKAIKEAIDKIEALQKDGVDTDEEKAAYNDAVKVLEEKAPQYKEVIDQGKTDYKIDTDKLKKQYEEESEAYESSVAEEVSKAESQALESATDENGNYTLPAQTDENGEATVIELPTVRIK